MLAPRWKCSIRESTSRIQGAGMFVVGHHLFKLGEGVTLNALSVRRAEWRVWCARRAICGARLKEATDTAAVAAFLRLDLSF